MCDYQGYDFGASYPDACCINGYLWDLDSCEEPGGPLYSGGELPCPQCNHEEWLEWKHDDVTDLGYIAGVDGASRSTVPFVSGGLLYPGDIWVLCAWWWAGWKEGNSQANGEEFDDERRTANVEHVR